MKNPSAVKKREENPIKLVWLITLLSFSVGVFMVYIVWSTLTSIRTERENLFELKENFISIQTKLENSLSKQKSVIEDLLEVKLSDSSQNDDYILVNLLKDYRQVVSDPILAPAFEKLDKNINSLLSTKNKITWWASAYNRTVPRIPSAKKEVESILYKILETVDKAEGQQRLDRAAMIRKIKKNYSRGSKQVDIAIINQLTEQ
ncbi:MAG: hypothetical protein OES28_07760, partial [Desulfobulbaceae bacterium]|nr:hypothetical protein [Desulfobulbaceae bacterium]